MKRKKPSTKELHFAVLATDVVIFTIHEKILKVLLIDVHIPPFYKHMLGVPGGLIRPHETADASVRRHLKGKTGVVPSYIEQLYTFSSVNRDPRGRVVSVAYLVLVSPEAISKSLNARKVYWKDAKRLLNLAYDHNEIVKKGLERLEAKLGYSTIAQGFLKPQFTLGELQEVYEVVLRKKFDKRNFRKKLFALNLVRPTGGEKRGGANRPAALHKFAKRQTEFFQFL
ncbi:MAG: hypothetical protein A2842_02645 [Candidatus Wildermuthbacteria bacterium RIFCSPHIGHO2_01_FULL_48_25]|uniref:Uncharacterized protein n=1 Tax=Candidatus Wildermuthbacteria bacterium RIFCSPLOWO2_01_FULL_48_16 TaxID=1802461 RepID=A0A1G2RJZ1_9BACT|nr:MAG: hypothetical protein A2842_02645 [Candidatus Wildermuthbacteria bacterium RIFCSPHIGHO2_01_FULL_48_25]OHA72838.1 MAG: hypothetical protein A3B24_00010 [Candidatus Wildermuthbacteria bacterium RIFCSPLOWO2_01_FULL_48_16]